MDKLANILFTIFPLCNNNLVLANIGHPQTSQYIYPSQATRLAYFQFSASYVGGLLHLLGSPRLPTSFYLLYIPGVEEESGTDLIRLIGEQYNWSGERSDCLCFKTS